MKHSTGEFSSSKWVHCFRAVRELLIDNDNAVADYNEKPTGRVLIDADTVTLAQETLFKMLTVLNKELDK